MLKIRLREFWNSKKDITFQRLKLVVIWLFWEIFETPGKREVPLHDLVGATAFICNPWWTLISRKMSVAGIGRNQEIA